MQWVIVGKRMAGALLALFVAGRALAASGGPDAAGYSWRTRSPDVPS